LNETELTDWAKEELRKARVENESISLDKLWHSKLNSQIKLQNS
jgi:hypothetical protein